MLRTEGKRGGGAITALLAMAAVLLAWIANPAPASAIRAPSSGR